MKRLVRASVFALAFAPVLAFSAQAQVAQNVTVVCADSNGNRHSFVIAWDNSQSFFNGKGQISRLFCEGGYAGQYRTFISNNLVDLTLDYYQGIVPAPSTPVMNPVETQTPVSQPAVQDTATTTSETQTAVAQPVETSTSQSQPPARSVDTPTAQVESATASSPSSDSHTASQVVETSTVTVPETTSVLADSTTTQVAQETQLPGNTSPTNQTDIPSPAPIPSAEPSSTPEPSDSATSAPAVVQPDPLPEPIVQPDPVPQEPAANPEPSPDPVIDPVVPEPEPASQPDPSTNQPSQPSVPETPVDPTSGSSPEIQPQPNQNPTPSEAPVSIANVDVSTLPPNTPVELENGVVLTAGVVVALQLLDNPAELLSNLFTDPAKVFTALSNIGADMSPKVRETAKKTVLASIIAGGIATNSAVSAASVAAYRRKP